MNTKPRIAIVGVISLVAGLVIGRGCRTPRHVPTGGAGGETPAAAQAKVWTCSMHPQIRLPNAGKCPICEMPLVVAAAPQTGAGSVPVLEFSDHALAVANVETAPVTRRAFVRDLRAVGKIQYSESSLATITARIDGYAERLFVDFTGVAIKAGDHLAEIYSPDLLVAQQELLFALPNGTGTPDNTLAEMAKLKLRRWGLTQGQIDALIAKRELADRVTLYSPIEGTVIEKSIMQNSAFKAGDALYRIANLDTVWVYLDIYEVDLPWVRYGQRVELAAEALPGRAFEGLVTFVQPIVNEETRTIRVPVHIANRDHALKPGMFVSAVVRAALASNGQAAPTGIEGKFSCPMHPQVLREQPGPCPICEMPLEQIPGLEPTAAAPTVAGHPSHPRFYCPMKCEGAKTYDQPGNCPVCEMTLVPASAEKPAAAGPGLPAVPVGAVLDSGTRRIVYVERSRGLFEAREVVLGPRSAGFVSVLEGLAEGERVATRGGFLIDSQFQITGHPSLFHPGGLMAGQADQPCSEAPAAAAPPADGAAHHQH